MTRKTADALYIPLPLPGGLCFSARETRLPRGGVSDVLGDWSSDLRGAQMFRSKDRTATLTRRLVAGLGAVALAVAMTAAGPQEAKAQNGTGAIIHINNQFGNFVIGPNNGGQTGNGGLFGINNQFFNVAIGANNGAQDGNGGILGVNTQIGNLAIGFNNGSQDGNGFLAGINTQIGNTAIGFNNGSQDGNGLLVGVNTQIGNRYIGFNNGSQDGNGVIGYQHAD